MRLWHLVRRPWLPSTPKYAHRNGNMSLRSPLSRISLLRPISQTGGGSDLHWGRLQVLLFTLASSGTKLSILMRAIQGTISGMALACRRSSQFTTNRTTPAHKLHPNTLLWPSCWLGEKSAELVCSSFLHSYVCLLFTTPCCFPVCFQSHRSRLRKQHKNMCDP